MSFRAGHRTLALPLVLDSLTLDTFAAHLGQRFEIRPPDAPAFDTTLDAATPVPGGEGSRLGVRRTPFSLVFRGPRDRLVPQRSYEVRHAALGTLELFLVPIGSDEEVMRYEAVFT